MSYGALIQDTPRREIVWHDWGGTKDIQKVIMAVCDKDDLKTQVAAFAQQFKGASPEQQREGLRRLWQTCRREIRYKEDPSGLQAIKHPARTWSDRSADCKSLTVFIYHCCRAVDVPCFIRFASYDDSKRIGHVYPVAVVGGVAVPVDAVWNRFNDEESPTYFQNHLPAVFANDATMVRAVRTSVPDNPAIGALRGFQTWKNWQKAVAALLGGWVLLKITQ